MESTWANWFFHFILSSFSYLFGGFNIIKCCHVNKHIALELGSGWQHNSENHDWKQSVYVWDDVCGDPGAAIRMGFSCDKTVLYNSIYSYKKQFNLINKKIVILRAHCTKTIAYGIDVSFLPSHVGMASGRSAVHDVAPMAWGGWWWGERWRK